MKRLICSTNRRSQHQLGSWASEPNHDELFNILNQHHTDIKSSEGAGDLLEEGTAWMNDIAGTVYTLTMK